MIDISNQQIIDLLKELPTKKDLVVLKAEISKEFDSKLDTLKTDLTRVIETKVDELKNYMEKNVGLMVEDAINPILDNHDERIIQLEKKTGVPTIPMKPARITN